MPRRPFQHPLAPLPQILLQPSKRHKSEIKKTGMLYRSVNLAKVGQCFRHIIEYSPFDTPEHYAATSPKSLWVRIRNTEPIPMRAAYLAGPYVLYVDCKSSEYNSLSSVFATADQPVFEPQLLPGQTFFAELLCHTFKEVYKWEVDVVSQILFNSSIGVNFEVCIAREKDQFDNDLEIDPCLEVTSHDTLDLWNLPVPKTDRPVHLVILTHGLHSNVSADMLFLKEQIDNSSANVIVKGFFGNVCKTERGIKYLGSRVADYIVDLVTNHDMTVDKISFVGHLLGGLVQTFAIAYLEANFPWFFKQVQPVNFITLASPMLGVIHENPAYVKLALLAGIVGRTGQDLGLVSEIGKQDGKPFLLLLPSGPTHRILKRFVRRTVYANIANDGIVPLRTSALLYLDYQGLAQVGESADTSTSAAKIPHDDETILPFLAVLSYFMPQKQTYDRFQTNHNTDGTGKFALLKPSVLESATSLILPPLPSMRYITNPESRDNVIMHDKVYYEDDLPQQTAQIPREKAQGMIQRLSDKGEELRKFVHGETEAFEEEIAREYHKLMLWRKVLVKLKPDAHNNIVVRRRFANAYGWPVIDHLVLNHFDVDDRKDEVIVSDDLLDVADEAMTMILHKDIIQKENEDIEKQLAEEHTWVNSKEEESIFTVGPAGLLLDLSERVWNFKDQWNNRQNPELTETPVEESVEESVEGELGLKKIMGGFM